MRAIKPPIPTVDGIFGDRPDKQGTPPRPRSKPDRALLHFSWLSLSNVPEDELGTPCRCEFLIEVCRRQRPCTAQNFTNHRCASDGANTGTAAGRNHLHDPTCGTGGSISALDEVKRSGGRTPHPAPLRAGAIPLTASIAHAGSGAARVSMTSRYCAWG